MPRDWRRGSFGFENTLRGTPRGVFFAKGMKLSVKIWFLLPEILAFRKKLWYDKTAFQPTSKRGNLSEAPQNFNIQGAIT